ncbi:hypothetical protein DFH06DRAFT_1126084 [Mycena polygramma]|nr:hypothetical protein DFH06DRAFT_1126084 [Mycena polygramma]
MLSAITHNVFPFAATQPPPPPVVMLSSATDLHLPALRSLTVHEDLRAASKRRVAPPVESNHHRDGNVPFPQATTPAPSGSSTAAFLPAPLGSSTAASLPLSSSATVPAPSGPSTASSTASATASPASSRSLSGSPLSSLAESDGGLDDNGIRFDDIRSQIPRPSALTRKALASHSQWTLDKEKTKNITEYAHEMAAKWLDTTQAWSYQDKAAVNEMHNQFPELKAFVKDWPVKCILMAHLKVTSNASKNSALSELTSLARRKALPTTTALLNVNAAQPRPSPGSVTGSSLRRYVRLAFGRESCFGVSLTRHSLSRAAQILCIISPHSRFGIPGQHTCNSQANYFYALAHPSAFERQPSFATSQHDFTFMARARHPILGDTFSNLSRRRARRTITANLPYCNPIAIVAPSHARLLVENIRKSIIPLAHTLLVSPRKTPDGHCKSAAYTMTIMAAIS